MFTLGTLIALLVLIVIVSIAGGFAYLMDKATVEHIKNKKEEYNFEPQVKNIEDDDVKFTIECTMKKRWVSHFLSMLKYMQFLGCVGSSREVALFVDGDGDFHPEFEWSSSLECSEKPVRDNDGDVMYDAG